MFSRLRAPRRPPPFGTELLYTVFMRATWKLTTDQRALIPSLYERGWTTARLSAEYGVSQVAVIALLRRRGVIFRPKPRAGCDDLFFRVIDSDAKAYWLGFLWADGTIQPTRGALIVSLATKDTEHIERLRRSLRIGNRAHMYRYGALTFTRVAWTSPDMVADLARHGFTTPRDLSKGLPDIPGEWIGAFVRGYFDGDGTVGIYRVNARAPYGPYRRPVLRIVSGSKVLLDGIAAECQRRNIHVRTRTHKTIFQLECDARRHLVRLREWMYGDGGPCLHRKRAILRRI